MKIERLGAADMQELLDVLNISFTGRADSRHFEDGLPKLWIPDDEHMGRHFAIRENGGIIAALGVYPLEMAIAGHKLRFSTVGNVATMPEAREKGCMKALMAAAMTELDDIGADASRLGGRRSRYQRYGYEVAGINYRLTLTDRNVSDYEEQFGATDSDAITFRRIESAEDSELPAIHAPYDTQPVRVLRGEGVDFFNILRAWSNLPHAAYRNGCLCGHICAKGGDIAEFCAETDATAFAMLRAWQKQVGSQISFNIFPWQNGLMRRIGRDNETISVNSPSHFKILNWDRVAAAFLNLKLTFSTLCGGCFVLGIDGKRLEIAVDGGKACVGYTEKEPDIRLDGLDAVRFLFGPADPLLAFDVPADIAPFVSSWLPLPLGWNGQDRV